jgi:hypothetical protein
MGNPVDPRLDIFGINSKKLPPKRVIMLIIEVRILPMRNMLMNLRNAFESFIKLLTRKVTIIIDVTHKRPGPNR